MIDPHLFILFMLGAVALNLTPGPDMAFVLAQSANGGPRQGMAAAWGIGTGFLGHMGLAAFGVTAVIAAWPPAFEIVRYAGRGYLLWLAIGMIRHPPHLQRNLGEAGILRAYRRGVLTSLTNPKVAMFTLAFLPQFISPHAGPAWVQILLLGSAFNTSGIIVNSAVAFAGGRIAARMTRDPGLGRVMGYVSGTVMGALAIRLVWPQRGF